MLQRLMFMTERPPRNFSEGAAGIPAAEEHTKEADKKLGLPSPADSLERVLHAHRLLRRVKDPEFREEVFRHLERRHLVSREEYEAMVREETAREEELRREEKKAREEGLERERKFETATDTLVEAFRSRDFASVIFEKTMEKILPEESLDPLIKALDRLDGVFDLEKRLDIVAQAAKEGLLTPRLEESMRVALLKNDLDTYSWLESYAKNNVERYRELSEEGRIPRRILRSIADEIETRYLEEADRIRKTPQKARAISREVEEIQESVRALPRDIQNLIKNDLGADAFLAAEGEGELPVEDIIQRTSILFGNAQATLVESAYILYKTIYEADKKAGKESELLSYRPEGKPIFGIQSMDDLAFAGREFLALHPKLPKATHGILRSSVKNLEVFLQIAGHERIKDAIRRRHHEDFLERLEETKYQRVIEATRLAETAFTDSYVAEGLRLRAEAIGKEIVALLHSLARRGESFPSHEEVRRAAKQGKDILDIMREIPRYTETLPRPLVVKRVLEEALFLNDLKEELQHSASSMEKQGGAKERKVSARLELFSPEALRRRLDVYEAKVKRFLNDPEKRSAAERRLNAIAAIREERNFALQVFEAANLQIIAQEDMQGFLRFLEVSAWAAEIEAREKLALAAIGRDKLRSEKISNADKESVKIQVLQKEQEADELFEVAEARREGEFVAKPRDQEYEYMNKGGGL